MNISASRWLEASRRFRREIFRRYLDSIYRTVLELTLKLKTDWEYLDRRDFARVVRATKRRYKTAKYGGKVVGLLVITDETATQLMERLRPVLEEITLVEDFWCQTAGRDAVGRHGNFCPFQSAIKAAWEEVANRTKAENVPKRRTRNIWLDNGIDYLNRKAAVKSALRPRGERKS